MKHDVLVLLIAALLAVFVVVSAGNVRGAEAPEEDWNRTYGGSNYDYGYAVQQTADGGYIITGYTQSFGIDSPDVWLIKTLANGTMDWSRTFGGSWYDSGYAVQQTTDYGYIVTGSTHTYSAGPNDVLLLKTAANGSKEWSRTFGGALNDYGYAVQQTADGGYIIAGSTASFSAGVDDDVWLIKTAANGTEDWNSTFGGPSDDVGHAVRQTTDGGYIVAGSTNSFGAGSGDVWLLKVAVNGTELWNSTFGGPSDDVGHAVRQTTDGGYIIAGSTNSFGASSSDVWLLKVAANGTVEWNSTFGGFSDDTGYSVQQTIDGGYIIAGSTKSFSTGPGDVWLLKTAANGTEEWNTTFGGAFDDGGHAVQQTTDGGYIVAGYTHSFGESSGDVWLIKLSKEPLYVPDTYPTIQQAVDNASSGDTIVVRDGVYTENVTVHVANLTLRSEHGSAFTTVTAPRTTSHVFLVTANAVTITGFSVRNATAANGIKLDAVHHCTISNITASNNCVGITVECSTNNNITGNTVYNSTNHGVYIDHSSNNRLTGNEVSNNAWNGIFLMSSNDNTLSGNRVYNNPDYGIFISSSNNNTITGNQAYANSYYGILFDNSSNNAITNNNAYQNNNNGIFLDSSCNNNFISRNAAYNNDGGIAINASNNNTLTDNAVSNNTYDGISVAHASNTIIANNTAFSNNYNGINLQFSSRTTVANNTASSNSNGFYLESVDQTILRNNTGCNNSDFGIEIVASTDNIISDNELYHNRVGLYLLVRCRNNRIINNTVYENTYAGVDLRYDCTNSTITENQVYSNQDGIALMSVSTSTISRNTVYNNSRLGIYLWLFGTSNDSISGNTIYDNGDGIVLRNASSSSSINCSGNDIDSNSYGIKIEESNNSVIVFSNIVTDNIYGIYILLDSNSNRIYNNYLNNSQNAYDEGNNTWNITPTRGTNIIGGQWLGGNYWNDYLGSDTDGDGLGEIPYVITGGAKDYQPLVAIAAPLHKFDTGNGTYPSIAGTHNGTIKPFYNLTLSKLYTYPCSGTGGHTAYVALSYPNGTVIAEAWWNGYLGDWHNITFNTSFTLYANETYNYTIRTGSYPQIIHEPSWNATGGKITCEEFVDVNGNVYTDWIPAIRLWED